MVTNPRRSRQTKRCFVMVGWLTWGQIKNRLALGFQGDLRFSDNEKIIMGSSDDAAMYFDGTYWRIDGSASELLVKLSAGAGATIYGGTVNTDDLILKGNILAARPAITIAGNNIIQYDVPTGSNHTFQVQGVNVWTLSNAGSTFTTTTTAATAFGYNCNSITTGFGIGMTANGLTSGTALEIAVDSDVVNGGKIIDLLSGSASDQSVFSVDEEGSIRCNFSDGTSKYWHEFHMGANSIAPGGSGATAEVLNAVFSYKLDATTEYVYTTFDIHSDWDAVSNIVIEVWGYLTNAETQDDIIRMEVRADYYGDRENANTAKTQTLTMEQPIDNFNAQYSVHFIGFTLPYNTGGNVVEKEDVMHLRIRLHDITTAPFVNAFNVTHITARYKTKTPQIES